MGRLQLTVNILIIVITAAAAENTAEKPSPIMIIVVVVLFAIFCMLIACYIRYKYNKRTGRRRRSFDQRRHPDKLVSYWHETQDPVPPYQPKIPPIDGPQLPHWIAAPPEYTTNSTLSNTSSCSSVANQSNSVAPPPPTTFVAVQPFVAPAVSNAGAPPPPYSMLPAERKT